MVFPRTLQDAFKFGGRAQGIQPRITQEGGIAEEAFIHSSRENEQRPVRLGKISELSGTQKQLFGTVREKRKHTFVERDGLTPRSLRQCAHGRKA